ncbi:putative cytoplasmic protein [Escherichia coli]|uniref:Putative cytoplasmic protein n=1 Tax=Escherichia coli TaxID=562 RepID=A0A2X3JNV0_ECOLX|nr:putative cytoplasmic protein [Escherichia coli]
MFTSVAQANAAVIEQIRRARPHWLDVQPASSLISELNEGKTLLHAGPPMRWQEMTGPHERGVRGRMSVRRLGER